MARASRLATIFLILARALLAINQVPLTALPLNRSLAVTTNPAVQHRHYATEIRAIDATDTTPRQVRAICSTEDMDRAGDIVVQSGIVLDAYKNNPVVLYNHNTDDPIARASDIQVLNGNLEAQIDFPPPGVSPEADKTYGLIKAGIINAVSIGFKVLASEPLDPTKPRGAQRFLKSELLEFSFVPVPANPNALIVQRANVAAVKMTRKGLFAVGSLADILAYLGYLQEDAEWEAAAEGDGSQVPAMLLAAMQQLGAALIAMTQEEVAELLADDEPDADDDMLMMAFTMAQKAFGHIQKAGKVLSDKNHQKLSDAHAAIGDVLQSAKPASDDDADDAAKDITVERQREIEMLAFAPA
jgi:HK97 family phage prohead protease